jgi:hypothetical protein
MTIAHTLPEKLALIDAANAAGKSLQVNKDGGLQYASFGEKFIRLLGGIGQSDAWKLGRAAQLNELVKLSLEKSVLVSGVPGAGKYDRLLQNVRLAGELSGPGQIVTAHYRAALERFDQKQGLETYQPPAAPLPAPQTPVRTNFRPLPDVRLAFVGRAETDQAIDSLGSAGSTLHVLYETYRVLGEKPFASDRELRAQQAGALLSILSNLEDRIESSLKTGRFTNEQIETVHELLDRISGERSLIGGVLANTNPLNENHGRSWSDAIALRRLGVDLSDNILHPAEINPDSAVILGKGAMNEVYAVQDKSGEIFVYKPGQVYQKTLSADVLGYAAAHGADLAPVGDRRAGADLRFEARNLVATNLDRLVGTSLIIESSIAKIPVSKFIFKDEDISERGDLHSDFGLLMKKAEGASGYALAGTPELGGILGSRALKRDLSTLVLFDAILQSFDRHPGNYMIETQNGAYVSLKAIDNDFGVFATDVSPSQFRRHTAEDKDILAGRIPTTFKEQHRGPYLAVNNSLRRMADALDGYVMPASGDRSEIIYPPELVLTPADRARIAAAVDRFDAVKVEQSRVNRAGLGSSPEMGAAIDAFAADIAAAGFDESSPIGVFAKECRTVFEYISNLEVQRNELRVRLVGEGIVFGPSGFYNNETHNVGLPEIADKAIADRIRSPDFERALVESSQHLLTRDEITALSERLRVVQAHLNKLEIQGRLVSDSTWASDFRDAEGNDIDSIVARSGHSYWAALNQCHSDKLALNKAPAPAPAPAP